MKIYTRHFLGIFGRRFLWLFAAVQVFVLLCVLLDLLPRAPYLSLARLVQGLPDLLIIYLPISLPFPLVMAGVLFIDEVRRQQGFLGIQVAGHDPRQYQLGIVGFGLVLSLSLFWLNAQVIPRMLYSATYALISPSNSLSSLALLVAKKPDLFQGFQADFVEVRGNELTDFSLTSTSRKSPLMITAQRAQIQYLEPESRLLLTLNQGRFLKLSRAGQPDLNARFSRLKLSLDANQSLSSAKTQIIDLDFYSDRELARLPELVKYRAQRGVRITPQQKRLLKAVPQVQAARAQSALTPFLLTLILVGFLGAPPAGEARVLRTVTVILFCLALILPQQIIFQEQAGRGKLPAAWMALLPSLEMILALSGLAAVEFATKLARQRKSRP